MPASSWEYDRASGKSNASSGVLASISESWSRCRDFGLRAAGTPQEIVLSEDKFKVVLEKNESIRNFVLPELELLYNQIAGTNFMVAYADGGGIVLDSIQDHDFKAGEGGKAVIPGSVWIENHRGTNALGLAIHTRRPSIVTGKDHFFHKLDDLSCFAVPIFDHEETLLGVIDATSNAKARNDHTLALVKLASKNIENRLFTERFCDSIILTFHARQEYLPTTSAAMLAVDEYGFIEGANANAKSVLSGLDVSRQQHFGEIFDVQFFDVIDKLRSNEIISIKDRLGAVVFMRAQHSVSKKVINLEGDLLISNGKAQPLSNEKPSSNLLIAGEATKVTTVFDDELLTKEILEAKRTLEVGLPVTILGSSSTGKTEIAKEINNRAFGKSKFTIIDCVHLDPKSFETLLFGENGKLVFFDHDQTKSGEGKLFQARGGVVFFKNAQTIPEDVQDLISTAMEFEEKKRENSNFHSIRGWIFSAPQDWLDGDNYKFSSKFENAIQGKKLTAPPLSQRSDFEKLAMSIIASCSTDHTLSPVALRILRSSSWTGNFSQLKKVIRLAVSKSSERIIRQEITEAISSFVNDDLQPCLNCHGSPVRSETCIMIQRTWSDTGGNVSLVSRRLGVSRNTVYKHVKNIQ